MGSPRPSQKIIVLVVCIGFILLTGLWKEWKSLRYYFSKQDEASDAWWRVMPAPLNHHSGNSSYATMLVSKISNTTSETYASTSDTVSPQTNKAETEPIGSSGYNFKLKVLIAKTVSQKDILDTVADIHALSNRDENITVEWKIFCHEQSTYGMLQHQLKSWNKSTVAIHVHEQRYKLFFWHKYLSPKDLSPDIQYLWMVDGDVRLRYMAWTCFWKLVHETYKPAIFEPAILTGTPSKDNKLYYAGKAHFQKCYSQFANENFHRLQALETQVIDIQTPGFRRDAWDLIYTNFDRELGAWGNFSSDWGPDFVFCKMVEEELLKRKPAPSPANDWTKVQKTCDVPNATSEAGSFNSATDPPIACLILHETPVFHQDTQSLKAQRTGLAEWQKMARLDLDRYRDAFANYSLELKNDIDYFRSFLRQPDEEPCQACKSHMCMP